VIAHQFPQVADVPEVFAGVLIGTAAFVVGSLYRPRAAV
jgi:hypothetical protein